MRSLALGVVLFLLVPGVVSCTTDDSASKAGPERSATGTTAAACDEVVRGIAAFNAGDFDATVTHFEAAVPLAEAAQDDTSASEELLAAVRYYAELPPEGYLEASATSPEFAKYKAITLGQCAGDGNGAEQESPGQIA